MDNNLRTPTVDKKGIIMRGECAKGTICTTKWKVEGGTRDEFFETCQRG